MNKALLEHLESLGPEAVLREMAQGKHGDLGSQTRHEVESWLRAKIMVLEAEDLRRRDAREGVELREPAVRILARNGANQVEISAAQRLHRFPLRAVGRI